VPSWRNLDFVVSAACKGFLDVAGIQKWTGREARALREALRMSGREFAERLGMSGRAISKWESPTKPTLPRADSQAMLDTMLANATEEERARFERFLADNPAESARVIMQQAPVEQEEISSSLASASSHAFPAGGSAHVGTLDVGPWMTRGNTPGSTQAR
jgi:transcriptional regulator with XRE-family HTH domain